MPLTSLNSLSKADAKAMVKKYNDDAAAGSGYDRAKHTVSVWFSCDHLQSMVETLLEENGDGIRVYFGKYPETEASGVSFPRPDTNTVIFVSTRLADNKHVDYFDHTVFPFDPQNRGEQCQPYCDGLDLYP